jgi:hypothetical protein
MRPAERPSVDFVRYDLTICGRIWIVQRTAPIVPSAFSTGLFSVNAMSTAWTVYKEVVEARSGIYTSTVAVIRTRLYGYDMLRKRCEAVMMM